MAKARGRIRNLKLMARIAGIIMKLLATFRALAMRAGRARAERLYACLKARGASKWAPRALEWLKDKKFVLYLGVLAVNG